MRGDSTPEQLLAAVTQSLVRTLVDIGYSTEQIRTAFEDSIGAKQPKVNGGSTISLGRDQRDCMEVMCLWRREPRFLGPDGLARPLVIDGTSDSFEDLYRCVNTDGDYRKALGLLSKLDAVRLLQGNRVEPLTPTLVVTGVGLPVASDSVMKIVAGFLGVVEHNVSGRADGLQPRFERSCTVALPEEVRPIAERLIAERGQMFIDTVDEHLMRLARTPSRSGRLLEVGVGAYCVNFGSV